MTDSKIWCTECNAQTNQDHTTHNGAHVWKCTVCENINDMNQE